jgi:hypothetical protein
MFFLVIILFIVGYLLFSTYNSFYFGFLNSNPKGGLLFPYRSLILLKNKYKDNLRFNVYMRTYTINHGTTIEII